MDTHLYFSNPLLSFLTAKGSLTAHLEKVAGQPLVVQILQEKFRPLSFDEKHLLSLPKHRPMLAWERQVLLFGNTNKAWVQATSLFPLSHLQGGKKRLRHLKNTPIGYVLFKKNRQLAHKRYYYTDKGQYGRKTVYEWQSQKILIQELFLTEFEQVFMQKSDKSSLFR